MTSVADHGDSSTPRFGEGWWPKQAERTPLGPVWLVPDFLGEKGAKKLAQLDLWWPENDEFVAMHTGPSKGGAFLVRAPLAALEACGLPTGSAAEHPVADGTVWPPLPAEAQEVSHADQ